MTPEEHADSICHWRTQALRERVVGQIRVAVAEERERILGEFQEAWAKANEHQGQCPAVIQGVIGLLRAR